jgi:sortase (surface protein transpeptidase)
LQVPPQFERADVVTSDAFNIQQSKIKQTLKILRTCSRREVAWWGTAAMAFGVGVAALVGTIPQGVPASLVLSKGTTPLAVVQSAPAIRVPTSRPLRLIIPALNINTPVGVLGLQPDHQLMVPTSAHVVDWYVDGPTPGSVGSAVMLGHVDSFDGPGTFFYLKTLKAGDTIEVRLVDGTDTHFVVTRVVEYAKTSFPDRLVFGSHGIRSLELVTCGGVFDHETGHYESNIVVFSRLVSAVAPASSVATR